MENAKKESNKDFILKEIQKFQKEYNDKMEAYQNIVRRYHFSDSMPEDVSKKASLLVTEAMDSKCKANELMEELGIAVPKQKIVSNAKLMTRKEIAKFLPNII